MDSDTLFSSGTYSIDARCSMTVSCKIASTILIRNMQYERYRDKRHTEKNSSNSNTMDPLKHVPKKNRTMNTCCYAASNKQWYYILTSLSDATCKYPPSLIE